MKYLLPARNYTLDLGLIHLRANLVFPYSLTLTLLIVIVWISIHLQVRLDHKLLDSRSVQVLTNVMALGLH